MKTDCVPIPWGSDEWKCTTCGAVYGRGETPPCAVSADLFGQPGSVKIADTAWRLERDLRDVAEVLKIQNQAVANLLLRAADFVSRDAK